MVEVSQQFVPGNGAVSDWHDTVQHWPDIWVSFRLTVVNLGCIISMSQIGL